MSEVIKKLSIDDYEQIVKLWADAGLPYKPNGRDSRVMMSKEMQQEGVAYFGLYENSQLLAVGIANYDGRRGWINRVAVDPQTRAPSPGVISIYKCEKLLRPKGAVLLPALIEDINEPSISCFKKAGYIFDKSWLYFSKRDFQDS